MHFSSSSHCLNSGNNSDKVKAGHTYILHEISAPDDYEIADDISFSVTADGWFQVNGMTTDSLEMIDLLKDLSGEITNKLIIKKQDENGKAVKGATLQILQGNVVIDEWKTDGTDHNVGDLLVAGVTYVLHEEKVPDGYQKADDMTFAITNDGNILYNNNESKSLTMVDKKKTETEGGSEKGKKSNSGGSVRTGDETPILLWMMLLLAGVLGIGGTGVYLRRRTRRQSR